MFNRKNSQDIDAYVEERLSDYLDGTLSDKERAMVQAHLATSERARASLESLRYTVNLLKQTPAPVLPRQFTLPVTSRAPVNTAPSWLVWGLRGVGAAATAAFVILLVVNLTRPTDLTSSARAPQAATTAPLVVALAADTATPISLAAPASEAYSPNPSPIMQTEVPSVAMSQTVPVTETPTTAVQKSQPPQQDADTAQATVPPPPTSLPAPVSIDTPTPDPTVALPAGGAAANSSVPESSVATATDALFSQRSSISAVLEGQVTIRDLIVRAGPGIGYDIIGGLHLNDVVQVMGRSSDNNWLWVKYQRNRREREGWVSSAYIRLNGLVDSLPVKELGGLETPGATPQPLDTAVPADDGSSDDSATPTPAQVTPDVPVTPADEPTDFPGRSPTVPSTEGDTTETPSPEATEPGRAGPAETPTE